MKKVEQAEELANLSCMFAPMTAGETACPSALGTSVDNSTETAALDILVSALRWTFIYTPGALLIQMLVMTLVLLLPGVDSPLEMLVPAMGSLVVGAFLIMFGIGKVRELRYLRVVGTILATSVVFSVVSTIGGAFFSGDVFTWILFCAMPLTLIGGYLAKKNTDRLPS